MASAALPPRPRAERAVAAAAAGGDLATAPRAPVHRSGGRARNATGGDGVSADFAQRYGAWAVVAGASEGIGAAFARALAGRGLNLVLVARRAEPLAELAGSLPVRTVTVAADLSTSEGVDAVLAATEDLEVGLVVCNAAYSPIGPFIDTDPALTHRALRLNCAAPLALAHAYLPVMALRRRGGFVIMSSLAGAQGSPGIAVYAATKAFGAVLAEGLWEECRRVRRGRGDRGRGGGVHARAGGRDEPPRPGYGRPGRGGPVGARRAGQPAADGTRVVDEGVVGRDRAAVTASRGDRDVRPRVARADPAALSLAAPGRCLRDWPRPRFGGRSCAAGAASARPVGAGPTRGDRPEGGKSGREALTTLTSLPWSTDSAASGDVSSSLVTKQ